MSVLKAFALFLISPLNIAVCVVIAIWFFIRAGNIKLARLGLALVTAILLIFSQPYTAVLLLYPLEHTQTIATQEQIASADYLYTPGCYYQTDGEMNRTSRWSECSLQRLVQTAILAKKYNKPVIVTGGNFLEDETVNYATMAAEYLTILGVPKQQVIVEPTGTTTNEEINAIAPLISGKSVVAISSATHGRRVSRFLAQYTKSHYFYAVDYQSSGDLTPFVGLPSIATMDKCRKAFYEYGADIKAFLFTADKPSIS